MIISKVQKQTEPAHAGPVKTSPASKSAAPEIYAAHDEMQHTFPLEEGRSTISGYDVKDWLIAEHPIPDHPVSDRQREPIEQN